MSLEEEFHISMLDSYRRTGQETGYWANYFNRDVQKKGGLHVAKQLLAKSAGQNPGKGLLTLIDHSRADLSVEALVSSPRFSTLFTPEELNEARRRLNAIPLDGFRRKVPPDEIHIEELDDQRTYKEGAAVQVIVNAYERSAAARKACLRKHGYCCSVCRMSFLDVYGEIGKKFIHVHHIKPLAASREQYQLNSLKDLLPVCPNCHAMLHTHNPPLDVEELKAILTEHQSSKT